MRLRRWHRNSVVVLIALIAVLAMHGLTDDHGTGMPGMSGTAEPAVAMAMHAGRTMAAEVVSADSHSGHAGGMCVGIIGIALLLWLIAQSRRRPLRVVPSIVASAVRAIQARAGPPAQLLCPSLVTLGISRT